MNISTRKKWCFHVFIVRLKKPCCPTFGPVYLKLDLVGHIVNLLYKTNQVNMSKSQTFFDCFATVFNVPKTFFHFQRKHFQILLYQKNFKAFTMICTTLFLYSKYNHTNLPTLADFSVAVRLQDIYGTKNLQEGDCLSPLHQKQVNKNPVPLQLFICFVQS